MKRPDNKDADVGGFTYGEIRRMARSLCSNVASVRGWVKTLGLYGMTTASAVDAIRKSR